MSVVRDYYELKKFNVVEVARGVGMQDRGDRNLDS